MALVSELLDCHMSLASHLHGADDPAGSALTIQVRALRGRLSARAFPHPKQDLAYIYRYIWGSPLSIVFPYLCMQTSCSLKFV